MAASAGGLGHLPLAPGTWASAAAAFVYGAVGALWPVACLPVVGGLWLASLAVGFSVCARAQEAYGQDDPRPFVLDEMAGQWLTLILFRWRGPMVTAAVAFVAFRIFDVIKPFPIRRLEELPGSWGVMCDDLWAALYAACASWALCGGILERIL